MSVPASEQRPTFRAVKDALKTHGFTWSRECPFKNDDTFSMGIFRGTAPDGRKVFAVADYDDDEPMEPEVIDQICRSLSTDSKSLKIDCGDGTHVSLRPVSRPTPPSRPALAVAPSSALPPKPSSN